MLSQSYFIFWGVLSSVQVPHPAEFLASCYCLSLSSGCSPQFPVTKHPQSASVSTFMWVWLQL